jgi:hypothetical protein
MDKVLQAMGMRGIMRQAVRLLKGMNIKHSDDTFTLEVFSHIGWFKVRLKRAALITPARPCHAATTCRHFFKLPNRLPTFPSTCPLPPPPLHPLRR